MGNNPPSDAKNNAQIDVRSDGRIILYKRTELKNPKWQARIRVPNATGYKIVSTKTCEQREAERFAENLYDELYQHVRAGGAIKSKTFKQVFNQWENDTALQQTSKGGSWKTTIERVRTYALKYFGSKKIDDIKASDFQEYWLWRKANYTKKIPSNSTLARERTSIRSLLNFAVKMGYISKAPDTTPPKYQVERRPTFTKEEWDTIGLSMDAWIEAGKATSKDRRLACLYFFVLANSGLRIGELRGLKWGDFRFLENGHITATVKGKTGKRGIVFQPLLRKVFNVLSSLRISELEFQKKYPNNPEKWVLKSSELVFCHPDGTEIKSFKRSFNSLLKFAKVPVKVGGSARTVYSLRHLYATQRLYADVSPFILAKQMGTSVEMLEQHYGHIVVSEAAEQITKSKAKKTKTRAISPKDFGDWEASENLQMINHTASAFGSIPDTESEIDNLQRGLKHPDLNLERQIEAAQKYYQLLGKIEREIVGPNPDINEVYTTIADSFDESAALLKDFDNEYGMIVSSEALEQVRRAKNIASNGSYRVALETDNEGYRDELDPSKQILEEAEKFLKAIRTAHEQIRSDIEKHHHL